ncbi:hypothetical protein O0Q62_003500 [Proteus mirabilis]|nr:hypothetical protein [Proteus mirabilis]ELB1171904.1 hypothetical protein [Proteus mirabilis]
MELLATKQNTVKKNPWRFFSILAYSYLFLGFWNVGLVAMIPALQFTKHGLLDEPILQLALVANILMLIIIIKSGMYNLKKLKPFYILEKSGFFNCNNGWKVSRRDYQIGCDNSTGIICICLISPINGKFDRHVSIVEFENISSFSFVPVSQNLYKVILTTNTRMLPQFVFYSSTKNESNFFSTVTAINNISREQFKIARGLEYDNKMNAFDKQEWLIK